MLEYNKNTPQEVKDKFFINGELYCTSCGNYKEVQQLKDYLNYNFIEHENKREPGIFEVKGSELDITFKYILKVRETEKTCAGIPDYFGIEIPLEAFIEPIKFPEYFI